MALTTYVMEGGVGKNIAFTSILNELAEKHGEPVQIWTPHFQVFSGNPLVKMVFDSMSIPIDDPRIAESDDIVFFEPYKSNFVKGDQHLIESFCELSGVPYTPAMRPVLYTDQLKPAARKWLKQNKITGQFIVIQFTGGQPPQNFMMNNAIQYQSSNEGRNYHPYLVNTVLALLREKYPNVPVVDCTLPNEPGYPGTIKCTEHWTVINEILKMSSGFIGVDSSVQHMCAASNVPGVVIWGNTRWTQFGWNHHKNMTFHQKKPFNDYVKADINDPRNIMVNPEEIVKVFSEEVFDKKIEANQVICASPTE